MTLSYYLLMGEDPRVEVPNGVLDYVVTGKVHVVACEVQNDGAEEVTVNLHVTGKSSRMADALEAQLVTPAQVTIPAGGSAEVSARVVLKEGLVIGEELQLAMNAAEA